MTYKGYCPICKKSRWLGAKGKICKPCSYPMGCCNSCEKQRKIYVDNLCYGCYQHRQVDSLLQKIESDFVPLSEYNKYLFLLYIRHIKRYRLAYFHGRQAQKFSGILESVNVEPIKNWGQIINLSKKYKLYHPNGKNNGYAFLKIGNLLQELGVLKLRREDRNYYIKDSLSQMPFHIKEHVASYAARLGKKRLCESTIENHIRYLRDFFCWLEHVYPDLTVCDVTESKMLEYSQFLITRSDKIKFLRDNIFGARRFFAWLIYLKKIQVNPCRNINPRRPQQKISICSDEQIEKLTNYICDSDSDPEGALLISLILFYGFTAREIQTATIETDDDDFVIRFDRSPRSYGRHYYNRNETLKLPKSPSWFHDLQKRFYSAWKSQYEDTKKIQRCPRLVLPKHRHYTRPLCDRTLNQRIYNATMTATGSCIQPRILRQTCGHLYSGNQDGSLLSKLGWSPQFAFQYTWLPRKIAPDGIIPKYLEKKQKKIS